MVGFCDKSRPTIRIPSHAGMLCLALLSVFSTVSASSAPTPEVSPTPKSVTVPRNYCSADVAALGTGLARTPIESGTKTWSRKSIKWTGWIRASASGKYEFSLPYKAARILINQRQIFAYAEYKSEPTIIQIELLTNRYYAISVEVPYSKGSTLPLQWRRPDGRHETVPKAYLYAPLATARDTNKI